MNKSTISKLRSTCFFCSKTISGKKSQEHIIPDSLLGRFDLKEERLIGKGDFLYSRVKVPAHEHCNKTFGSRYENKALELLNDPEKLYYDIVSEEDSISWEYGPWYDSVSIISTWMSKLYYGVFYNDLLKVDDQAYKRNCYDLIKCQNFELIQKSYKHGYGFCLPSSLFAFMSQYEDFDFRTYLNPNVVLLKIGKLSLLLCIADGHLTKSYLDSQALTSLRKHILKMEKRNSKFPSHIYFFGEVVAHRLAIPRSPKIISVEDTIVNLSLSSSVNNPYEYYKINNRKLDEIRVDLLQRLGFSIDS